jgi:hypothetical protein
MQMHVSEAADPEGNLPARLTRGYRVLKMLFVVGPTFDDGKQDLVSGHIFQGTSSGCVR